MATKPRIAVIGAGLIGRRHVEHVAREAELAGIVDPTQAAYEFAAGHSVRCYDELDALLAEQRPDGVIVATPNQMHELHGLQCIRACIPVLIEKPVAADVEAANRLVAAAEDAKIPLLVGHHRRYNPLIAQTKARISAGLLGRIVAVHMQCWFYKPDHYFETEWRRQPGGGPVLINMIHDIDLLRHLCGEIVSVQAKEASAVRGLAVEDTAAVILRFANGALGTLTISDTVVSPWSWELTLGENPAYPKTGESCCTIGGTHGSLSIPDLGLWSYAGERDWWQPISRQSAASASADPLAEQVKHFCDVILTGAAPIVSGRDGLAALKVLDAIKHAARTGLPVDIH